MATPSASGARPDAHATTGFLNVDVDVLSSADLEPLVTALGHKVFVLFSGRTGRTYRAHFELSATTKTADATVRRLAALIHELPRAARARWNSARVRDFNIGIQSGVARRPYELPLRHDTIKLVSDLHARLVVTVYSRER